MITGINEYRKKVSGEKEVSLPSGAVFKIKKITGRDFVKYGMLPLKSTMEIARAKNNEEVVNKLTEEERKKQIEAMDRIIVIAVKEPKLSLEKKEGFLCIDELSDEDYYKLVTEITNFSFGGGGENLRPFRNEQNPVVSGQNGDKIWSSASPDIK